MSVYEQGRVAFHAEVPAEHCRHWPAARREDWLRGWKAAQDVAPPAV